jgi:putative hydrolase of the HAD superfamily
MTDPTPPAEPSPAAGHTAPAVRAVWTDFGGVLTPSMRHTWGAFCATLDIDPQVLLDAVLRVTASYGTQDLMEPLDTPLVPESEWLAKIGAILAAEHGYTVEITTLGDIWFRDRETNHVWADQLRALRGSGLFVGVLSNMVPTWDEYWRRLLPIDEMFDDVVLSFEVGTRKPQPEVFALAASRAGVAAENCLLVDDLEVNCTAAVAAGWQAIQFLDNDQAIAELEALLAEPTVLADTGVTS